MDKPFLQQLYDGELYPAEEIVPDSPEERRLNHEIRKEMEALGKNLTEEDCQRIQKITRMDEEKLCIYAYENFAYGFRLGMRMMAETILVNK